ncbi:MAG: type II toxin-antitoxin system PemK/MazF family toxin, partial [Nanoarchaeota archaeon]
NSEDILVAGVTSNVSKGRYAIILTRKDLEEGKLFTNCSIKCENVLKIDKEIVIKKIGKIKKEKLDLAINKILEIIR